MTGPGEDSHKHKSDDAARYLAESFFGLNMNPADVGGEVLFDDYDDTKSEIEAGASSQNRPTDRAEPGEAFSTADSGNSSVTSAPNRFEENLDDLIVFSDDDDDDNDVVDDEDDDEEDDENFDFGEEEEEDDDDEEDEFDDDEEEDDEDEDEDELDDADLDFGDDVIVPAPKKAVPVARESRPARDERGVDSRTSSGRSSRASAESRVEQRPASAHRDEQRNDRRDERPASRGSRPQESRPGARADSRGSDRPPLEAQNHALATLVPLGTPDNHARGAVLASSANERADRCRKQWLARPRHVPQPPSLVPPRQHRAMGGGIVLRGANAGSVARSG